jgi:hypothetical protein
MEQLQRKVFLGTSAAMRSTVMEAILGLPPLDFFVMGEALKARARMRERMKDTWDGVSRVTNERRCSRFETQIKTVYSDFCRIAHSLLSLHSSQWSEKREQKF